ncbi:MAG TPA: CDP-alcohol phosphatidyltransferase family protein [Fibrobacteraceae bacterium]|nr:CDP-alcohol phosphatidyltransferase family protein [Fibrobacteraceae bacterium]
MLQIGDQGLALLAKPFIRLGVPPNAISISGAVLSLIGAGFLAYGYRWTAVAIALAGSLLDNVDGRVARASGKVTAWGAFLDSTLDRITETVLALAILSYLKTQGLFSFALALWVIAGVGLSQLVSYLRARTESLGGHGKMGLLQRQHRGILILFGLLLGPEVLYGVVVTITVLSGVTAIQRMINCHHELEKNPHGP